jgi:hypothetical protein
LAVFNAAISLCIVRTAAAREFLCQADEAAVLAEMIAQDRD